MIKSSKRVFTGTDNTLNVHYGIVPTNNNYDIVIL